MTQAVPRQTTGGTGNLGSSGSVGASFGSLPAAGSAIIVAIAEWVGAGVGGSPSVSDNQGNSYTRRGVATTGTKGRSSIWIAENIGTPGGTFTVTYTHGSTGSPFYGAIRAIEVTGNGTSSFDVTASNSAASSTNPASANSGTTAATAQADEIAIAVLAIDGGNSSTNIALPSGYTDIFEIQDGASILPCRASYKVLSATGTQSADWGSSINPSGSTGAWASCIATFKAAISGAAANAGSHVASRRNRVGRGPYSHGRYFRPGNWLEVKQAAPGWVLVVADAAHGHAVDAVALSQSNTLAVADTIHAQSVDAPALTQAHILAVADALHAHVADAVSLAQANTLAVADALHAHAVDGSLALTVGNVLAVNDAMHAHTADGVALVQSHLLAVADALHGHAVDAVTLQVAGTLNVADAVHAHAVDSPALTQASALIVQDTVHGHTVDALNLSEGFALAVADALHAHAVDAVALTQAHVLAVQDATHGHLAESVALTQANVLIVSDTLHAHLVDAVSLRMPGEVGASTLFVVQAADRILVVAHSQRYFTVH